MAEDFEYVSHSRLEYHEGLRHAFLGDVPEPVVYGVQGRLREYKGPRLEGYLHNLMLRPVQNATVLVEQVVTNTAIAPRLPRAAR